VRIVVTGTQGQLARSLALLGGGVEIVCIGRPHLDLEIVETIAPALAALAPDVVVNAAAYTAVDQAENDRERAFAINARGAGGVAEAVAKIGVPLIHVSTDYVFDGRSSEPYRESDPTAPLGVYGASKLEGEARVLAAHQNCAILRTAWVYSPFGKNFVRTMLRLAETREEIGVVADQLGSPTSALSLAETTIAVARNLVDRPREKLLRGVFHAVDVGEASWADLAAAVFEKSRARGGPTARVRRIATSDYPTPAARPASSRLSTRKLRETHSVTPPGWREALDVCMDRLTPRRAGEEASQ
jgi:dTDP-4-dehydrorhamnose reductase